MKSASILGLEKRKISFWRRDNKATSKQRFAIRLKEIFKIWSRWRINTYFISVANNSYPKNTERKSDQVVHEDINKEWT